MHNILRQLLRLYYLDKSIKNVKLTAVTQYIDMLAPRLEKTNKNKMIEELMYEIKDFDLSEFDKEKELSRSIN